MLGHTAIASAQSAEDRETARNLFEQGKTRRDAGDVNGALESFKRADALMNVPTTKLAVARAYASLGKLVEAREAALAVEQLPVAAKEPQPFTDARGAAAQLATELATRIPSITIELKNASSEKDVAVFVDDAPIPQDALKSPIVRRLNPGSHVIAAKVAGREQREAVTLAEKEQKAVVLDLTAPARPGPAPAVESARPSKPSEGRKIGPVVWAGLGVAAVGVVVGGVSGILSISNKSDADASCRDSKCPPQAYDSLDSAKTWATVSTIGFITAGVGVGVAAIGYFVLGKKPASTQTGSNGSTVRISPWISAGGAGATGTF